MIVKVTKKHIKNGTRGDGTCCPVTLALKDAGFNDVVVGLSRYYTFRYGEGDSHSLKTAKFIKDFDNGKKVKPFSFRAKKHE